MYYQTCPIVVPRGTIPTFSFIQKMMQQKKGFTLIEIILVIIIIGMLFGIMSRFFVPENKGKMYGEICANNILGKVSSYINKAVTGKGISLSGSAGVKIFPDAYFIRFDSTNGIIFLGYTSGSTLYINDFFSMTGTKPVDNCRDKSYRINFTGDFSELFITKNLKEDINKPGFFFSGSTNKFTGYISFILQEGPYKREFYRFQVDTRTQTTLRNKCLFLPNAPGTCKKWSEG